MFYITKIDNNIVDKIVKVIDKYKWDFVDVSSETSTEQGFQSSNIINIFDDNLKKEMLDHQCLYQDIFHIHYLEYFNGGYQLNHNHLESEEYSFILYLNDAIGDTIFTHKRIKPQKGLLVIFDSSLNHSGDKSINKKILVGAIKQKKRK